MITIMSKDNNNNNNNSYYSNAITTHFSCQGFHNPHAVAVSRDGSAIYVSEIGPNRIWKFLLESPAAY